MNESHFRIIDELNKSDDFADNIHKNYSYSTTLNYYIIGFFGTILAFIFTQVLLENLKGHQNEILLIWVTLGSAISFNFYSLWYQTWDSAKLTQIIVEKKNTFSSILFKYDYYFAKNPDINQMTVSQFVSWLRKNDKEFEEKYNTIESAKLKLKNWQQSCFHKIMRYISNILTVAGLLLCLSAGGKYVYFLLKQ